MHDYFKKINNWECRDIKKKHSKLDWNKQGWKKEGYLIRQDNTIYKYTIYLRKISFSSIGQDKSKLQKQISKLLILTETAAWLRFEWSLEEKVEESIVNNKMRQITDCSQ